MRSLRSSALVLLIVAACAEQNTPIPDNTEGSGADSGSGGKTSTGGKASTGGKTSSTGGSMADKAGATSTGGKTATGGSDNAGGDNAGGEPSSAGTGGKASGGTGGKANGGSGGTGGKGGSGGTSGSGGGNGSGGSGCKPSPTGPIGGISARYEPEITGASGTGIGSKLIIANTGQNTLDLGTLKLRYYLTNEVQAAINKTINWAWYRPNAGGNQVDKKGNVAFQVVPLDCTSASANAFLEFTFAGAGNLEPDHQIYFSWTANNGASQSFMQSNDYSFDAAAKEGTDDMKITVLKTDGTLVWGTEP
jgi:hypothetical protein